MGAMDKYFQYPGGSVGSFMERTLGGIGTYIRSGRGPGPQAQPSDDTSFLLSSVGGYGAALSAMILRKIRTTYLPHTPLSGLYNAFCPFSPFSATGNPLFDQTYDFFTRPFIGGSLVTTLFSIQGIEFLEEGDNGED